MSSTLVSGLISLVLSITPVLLDRSDVNPEIGNVSFERAITKETISAGCSFEATIMVLPSETSSSIGLVDDKGAIYVADGDGTVRYSAKWVGTASVNRELGFYVIENGVTRYVQNSRYRKDSARVKVEYSGSVIRYYLNGALMFTSSPHFSKDVSLRGYVGKPGFASSFRLNTELLRAPLTRLRGRWGQPMRQF